MKCILILALLGQMAGGVYAAEPAAPANGPLLYANDFSKAEIDKLPEDLLVLDGNFALKEEGGNKFLELPGDPLETYGVLFGPAEGSGVAVSARIYGTGKNRRGPRFGVGLNGVGGHRLLVEPGKKQLALFKGDEQLAGVPFAWESGTWTQVRLQLRKVKEGEWKLEGKAWKAGTSEPAEWTLTYDEKNEPSPGRPAVWGSPFSGTPIRFDDLRFERVTPKT